MTQYDPAPLLKYGIVLLNLFLGVPQDYKIIFTFGLYRKYTRTDH